MSVLKIKDQNNDWIQIPTIKGDKGDPFTYADFTPEQLESLKGKDGISPTVSVASDTSDDYRLSFTDETHTVTTPNLIPEAEKIFDVYPHDTASGAVASFPDGADGIPLKSCIVQVEPVQEGSGDPSPDNVRPISGFTGCEVQRTGKNLFDKTAYENIYTTYDYIDSSYRCKKIQLEPNTTYTASFTSTEPNANVIILFNNIPHVNGNSSWLDLRNASGSKTYITDDTGCLYIGSVFVDNDRYNARMSVCEIQIEEGSTVTDYEPYQGETYPITFPSEAGTVYGAHIDVINGELVVDRAIVDLGTKNWGKRSLTDRSVFYCYLVSENARIYSSISENMTELCSHYPFGAKHNGPSNLAAAVPNKSWGRTFDGSTFFVIRDDDYADATAFKEAMSGVQLCYELAEPLHYPLTPTEIKTLYGQNNIWADTGDTEVEYRADTTLYISRLTEPDADMVADNNITNGNYFMVGNNLYLATANIASGASVIVGTNASKVSLAQALNAIKG